MIKIVKRFISKSPGFGGLCFSVSSNAGLAAAKCLFALFATAILTGCSEQNVNKSPEESSQIELTEFKGETVVVPPGFPKELFDQSPEEFEAYYHSVSKSSRSNADGLRVLSYEELQPILQKCLGRYPSITSDNIISESDLERILRDFPELKTRDNVNDRRVVIFYYYQDLCKRDVILEIMNYRDGRNLRTLSPGVLSGQEQAHLLSVPAYASGYINAGLDANEKTQALYGNLVDSNMGNAFRHAVWNAFAIRNILLTAPASENQAIDFTQDGTSKHEMDDSGQLHTPQAAMDLHNNMSARVWMEHKVKWGIGPFRNMPSYNGIIAEMQAKAAIAIHYDYSVDKVGAFNAILNAHGGNNPSTWNNLYHNMYGPYEHLVRLL